MAAALAPATLVNYLAPGLLEGTRTTADLRGEQIENYATALLRQLLPATSPSPSAGALERHRLLPLPQ